MEKEAGIVAAATAAAVSPRARELFRRGAVYGLAGVLKAGDVVAATARGAVRGAKDGAAGVSKPSSAAAAPRPRQRKQSSRTTAARSRQRASGSGTRRARARSRLRPRRA